MKLVLLDDEPLAMSYLEKQLMSVADVEIAGKFTDPQEGLNYILETDDIDIVFTDIHMPEMNGFELADRLLGKRPSIHVVFVTAHDEYAIQAFEMNALDYVLKPVAANRLKKTLQRVQSSSVDEERQGAATDALHLKLFHQVSLDTGDSQTTQIRWRTARVQELFFYLLQHRGELVRKSVLADLLWPEYEPKRAYAQLYTAVYHIRKTLESYGDYFTLINVTEGYTLTIHNVQLDVEEWEKNIIAGMPVNEETIETIEHFMGLYTGDYLKEFDYWWAESERHRLKMVWLRVSIQMAEWYAASGQQNKAIERYLDICDRHPQVEEAHFALMKLFASMNNHLSVHRQYRLLVAVLSEELNEPPSPYITEWYNDWSRSHEE